MSTFWNIEELKGYMQVISACLSILSEECYELLAAFLISSQHTDTNHSPHAVSHQIKDKLMR